MGDDFVVCGGVGGDGVGDIGSVIYAWVIGMAPCTTAGVRCFWGVVFHGFRCASPAATDRAPLAPGDGDLAAHRLGRTSRCDVAKLGGRFLGDGRLSEVGEGTPGKPGAR